ncbi:MAG: hypothetical protein QF733_05560 [Phycisphaerales bacterium]|jgi:hypothetical protein|nr:hypothetical protein [Phycisphaerales bacterium]
MSEIPKPTDALEAAARLNVILETIRAASVDWRLSRQSLQALTSAMAADPSLESVVASHLSHRVDSASGVACDIAQHAAEIEALMTSLRRK